jgi:hypothetical protein
MAAESPAVRPTNWWVYLGLWALALGLALWTRSIGVYWPATFLVYFIVWNVLYFLTHQRTDLRGSGFGSVVVAWLVTALILGLLGWWVSAIPVVGFRHALFIGLGVLVYLLAAEGVRYLLGGRGRTIRAGKREYISWFVGLLIAGAVVATLFAVF